jgi:hypothetical protein
MTIDRMWLIRKSDRSYSRPLSEEQLLKMFENGQMNQMDELCCSMDYWFSIQDVNEMRKHFGDISFEGIFKRKTDEITQGGGSTAKIVLTPNQIEELKKKAPESEFKAVTPKVQPAPSVLNPVPASSIRSIKNPAHESESEEVQSTSTRIKNIIFGVLAILIVLWVLFWTG